MRVRVQKTSAMRRPNHLSMNACVVSSMFVCSRPDLFTAEVVDEVLVAGETGRCSVVVGRIRSVASRAPRCLMWPSGRFVRVGDVLPRTAPSCSWSRIRQSSRSRSATGRRQLRAHRRRLSFCDDQLIVPSLAAAGIVPADFAAEAVGTIDPQDSLDLQRGYLRTFFDTTFGRYDDLTQTPAQVLHPGMIPVP